VRDLPITYVLDEPMVSASSPMRAVRRGRRNIMLKDRALNRFFVYHRTTDANAVGGSVAVMEGGVLAAVRQYSLISRKGLHRYVATLRRDAKERVRCAVSPEPAIGRVSSSTWSDSFGFGDNVGSVRKSGRPRHRRKIVIGRSSARLALGGGLGRRRLAW